MLDKTISLDKEFSQLLDDNAEAAWLEYCRINGIDSNKESNEDNK